MQILLYVKIYILRAHIGGDIRAVIDYTLIIARLT